MTEPAVFIPLSLFEQPCFFLLRSRVLLRFPDGSPLRPHLNSLLQTAVLRAWIAWARARCVNQPVLRDDEGLIRFDANEWAVVLWAGLEEIGLWDSLHLMASELLMCRVLVIAEETPDCVTLAGYGALNEALDPLFVGRAQKGGNLRHWKKHREQAAKEAAAQVEVYALSEIALPFPSEDAPSKEEERRTLELVFGVAMALQVEIVEPSKEELSAGLHVLRTMSEASIEDTLTLIAAHRSRPDISGMPVREVLEGFLSLSKLLAGTSA